MKRKLTHEHRMKISQAMLARSRRALKATDQRLRRPVKAKVPDLLSALAAAVSARYDDAGDRAKAGIHLSCIGIAGEHSTWYAAVHRYHDAEPAGHGQAMGGQIVCRVVVQGNAQDAVARLALAWYALARMDQGVAMTQRALKLVLPPAKERS